MEDDDGDHVLHDDHEHHSEDPEEDEEDDEDDYLIDTNVLQQHHHQPEEEEATHKNNNGAVIPTEQQQQDDDDEDDDDVVDDMMTNPPPPYHPHPHPHPRSDGDGDAPLSHLIKSEHHHEDDTAPPPPPEFLYADAAHAQMMMVESDESGTEEDRLGFINLLESFCKDHALDFKPPKFYGEPLNCLKLWRAVTRLGGYERVTASKLWRQVGETFNPPKTCTTVSWTFRIFYEKALLEYEKHKRQTGELQFPDPFIPDPVPVETEITGYKTPGAGRARRDSAARAMQGWHSHRGYDYGEDKNQNSTAKREKHLKSIGISPSLMKKKASNMELAHNEADRQLAVTVVDIGPTADWVKINVRETKDCFEVYALVPGLLRDEVRVQSDPVGRLVITGQPEHLENPWGITPFKKVVNLPGRIDPHQTSAVVSLHGRLFVRVPFDQ